MLSEARVKLNDTQRARKRKARRKLIRQNWELYMFLIIPVAFILIFHYWPMFGVQIAFR